jgi:hypothetical protein
MEALMQTTFIHPKTMINLTAGLVGIIFDRFGRAVMPGDTVDQGSDLTEINGIGPTFARRLNEAGITNFGQLAELDAEQARALAHAAEWQADTADWIAQARQRVGPKAPVAA